MAFTVGDVYDEVLKIVGQCDQQSVYSQVTHAVEVLSNSGDFDLLLGYVDLCVVNNDITLPREVDTVLAVNVNGKPAILRDQMYRFHLNGLGDCKQPCINHCEDRGLFPTYRDLTTPSKLVAIVDLEDDENSPLWAYGYDQNGVWIRTEEGGVMKDGYRVPTVYGASVPDEGAPTFSRVVRIRKGVTKGRVRLSSYDLSDSTGVLVGVMDADETDPQYRRLRIRGCSNNWVRVMYRKRVYKIRSDDDLIPLPATLPLLMMLRALKAYTDKDLTTATGFEATARRLLTEAVWAHSPPTSSPMQINEAVAVGKDRDSVWVD